MARSADVNPPNRPGLPAGGPKAATMSDDALIKKDQTMQKLLTDTERRAELPALGISGWGAVPDRDAIRKVWKFRNFVDAWGFMSRAALVAEKLNHHPEWSNVYNVVDVTLSTHDCHGLSRLDIDLARKLDALASGAEVQRDLTLPVESLCQIRAKGT